MGRRADARQQRYDEAKARARRAEENRQAEIAKTFKDWPSKLSDGQMSAMGYKKNWRGKWVPK